MLKNNIITENINKTNKKISQSKSSWKDFILSIIYFPLLIVQFVLVFFFYNFYHLTFLTSFGWVFIMLFMIIGSLPRQAFKKYGEIEKGKSHIYTTKLVDKGIYAIIRHPYWLCWIFLSISVALMSQHWLMVIFAVFIFWMVYGETYLLDKGLIEKFGDEYKEYKEEVPRMNLILGLIKYGKSKRKKSW
ncbi:MAG: methyltransferase family protein [Candidatus Hodarchaeota archaeon]